MKVTAPEALTVRPLPEICEAVRQVRGEAGARQVPNADVVQYNCASPIATATILHR